MLKILIATMLIFSACKKRDRIDLTKEITPLTTKRIIVYDLNHCAAETDTFSYQWHTRKASDFTEGTTSGLADAVHLCQSLEDANRQLAWIKRNLRPTLEASLSSLGVGKEKAAEASEAVEKEVMDSLFEYNYFLQNDFFMDEAKKLYEKEGP